MNVFSYRLRPTSAWVTPFLADSLFGALCWEFAHRQGEADLLKLLDRFRKGDPPFVISNAFPGDLLPRPLVFPSKEVWVTRDELHAIREAHIGFEIESRPEMFREVRRLHGQNGSAYQTTELTWSDKGPGYFTLYARVTPEWVKPLGKLLAGLGEHGFGQRRATGRGQFTVEGEPQACPWLEPMPFENGFVSLSNFVPHENDPARGQWSIHVKYPKSGGAGNPNKGRLLQLEAGSCFQCTSRPKRWYGAMLPSRGQELHYGLALAIGIKWPG